MNVTQFNGTSSGMIPLIAIRGLMFGFWILAIILHVSGCYAIFLYKKKTNQNIILLFLSIVEVLTIISGALIETLPSTEVVDIISEILTFELLFIMYIITCDRLVCVMDPLKYNSRLTRKKVMMIITSTWVLAAILGVLLHVLRFMWVEIVFVAFVALYIILTIITYTAIIISLRKSRIKFGSNITDQRKKIKKEFLVPSIIIATFVLLYIVPFATLRSSIGDSTGNNDVEFREEIYGDKVARTISAVGLLVDPLTYIFFVALSGCDIQRVFHM